MASALSKTRFNCKYSREFKDNLGTHDVFYVEALGFLLRVDKNSMRGETASIRKSLKSILKRNNICLGDIIDISHVKTCGFCGRKNHEYNIDFTIDRETRVISITSISYPKKRDQYYCFSSPSTRANDGLGECRGKKLNPNSAEYVRVAHGLATRDDALDVIHMRNRSPFYKENHSDDAAYAAFQRAQFYGRDLEQVRDGINKIQSTRARNELGLSMRRSGYSAITREDGHLLRSNGERFFYRYAKEIGISQFIQTNGFYPDCFLCYDFYFPILDKYIEISGLDTESYVNRINEKQEKYGAIVLKYARSNRFFKEDCKALLDAFKEEIEIENGNL